MVRYKIETLNYNKVYNYVLSFAVEAAASRVNFRRFASHIRSIFRDIGNSNVNFIPVTMW